MSKEVTVELKLPKRFHENMRDTMKRNAWMGFDSVEDFMFDAIRRRVEDLHEMETFIGERRKK